MIRDTLAAQGSNPHRAAMAAGLPVRAIRNVLDGHVPKVDSLMRVCAALDLELYVGPRRPAPSVPKDLHPAPAPVTNLSVGAAIQDPVSDPRLATIIAVLADAYEEANTRGRADLEVRFWAYFPDLGEGARSGDGRRLARMAGVERQSA